MIEVTFFTQIFLGLSVEILKCNTVKICLSNITYVHPWVLWRENMCKYFMIKRLCDKNSTSLKFKTYVFLLTCSMSILSCWNENLATPLVSGLMFSLTDSGWWLLAWVACLWIHSCLGLPFDSHVWHYGICFLVLCTIVWFSICGWFVYIPFAVEMCSQ